MTSPVEPWVSSLVATTYGGEARARALLATELDARVRKWNRAGDVLARVSLDRSGASELDAIVVARPAQERWFVLGELNATVGSPEIALRRDLVSRLVTCGPPWGYLRSGLSLRDPHRIAQYRALGLSPSSVHVDLRLTLCAASITEKSLGADAVRVERSRVGDAESIAWIASRFGTSWAAEAEAAQAHLGLFLALDGAGNVVGFSAHSGHNAAVGTFGPLGVASEARGDGIGTRLAARAFLDLHARGFATVTVPWVEPRLTAFYAQFATSTVREGRCILRADRPTQR